MEQTTRVFMDYAAAFEQTYVDDDWSRLEKYFSKEATYEVRGGPFACEVSGRDSIFTALKKSIDGLDRRCSNRRIEVKEGPETETTPAGGQLRIGWQVIYQYQDAPEFTLPGRSVVDVADGVIVALRDEYNDEELESVEQWLQQYGQGLDGSYV